ncbi:MAG: hypothetical protein KDB14_05890, partial [Planctomycetales bacterium]|nr:hypothetical protein [Planctomycetales bacterium]
DDAAHRQQYEWGFARRPERELYLLASDPHQIKNVADQPEHRDLVKQLHDQLLAELRRTGDPRVVERDPRFEHPPFTDLFRQQPRKSKQNPKGTQAKRAKAKSVQAKDAKAKQDN